MWRRWYRNFRVEWHWIKHDIVRRWHLDTPAGIMGILSMISGLLLFIIIGNAAAHIFRSFVPWVSGSKVSSVYWESIGFGLKVSSAFLLFTGSLIIYFLLKFSERR
ncbi:MAG: hypothetical protein Q8911_15165 [Bacillota bacterium]|nr:hypothetical protein [Bacillota bacterium]